MPDDISKNTAYSVGTLQRSIQTKGYTILGAPAGIRAANSYALLIPSGSLSASRAYAAIANPAALSRSQSYMLGWNNSAATAVGNYAVLATQYPPYSALDVNLPIVEQRFPDCVSFGSSGGPGFKTSIFTVDSGLSVATIDWERLRSRYNVTFDHVPPADIEQVENFFYGVKGRGIAFRYKDWSDYTISNQNFFVGDGQTTNFQVFKRYISGGTVFDRIIKKLVADTTIVTLDGASLIVNQDYFVNEATGTVIFAVAPADGALGTIVSAEFDVPVRFDTDYLDVSFDEFRQLSISSLPLIEVIV